MAQMKLLNVKVPSSIHDDIASIELMANTSKSSIARAALKIGIKKLNIKGIDSHESLTRFIVDNEKTNKEAE